MLKFFNTFSGKKEDFYEINRGEVRMYTCGPTVYNFAHIGNFRAYLFEDLLRRYLKYKGYKVIQVMNITDIDDKTIKGAAEKKLPLNEFTKNYIDYFFEDIDTLGIERAEFYPRATEHINEMINIIIALIKNGFTYIKDGSVYYKIINFKNYGKLSKIDINKIKSGLRYDVDEYNKEDVRDFVLWKARKGDEIFWPSPFGDGRPGWHIECSAMAMKYLGEHFDIHTGGIDNIFPHHENEIAQSEGATGKKFVNYWLHCAHLNIYDDKMSKSKGNIINLRDIIKLGKSHVALRYFLISSHYRSPINFSEKELDASEAAIARLNNFINKLNFITSFSIKLNHSIDKTIKKCVLAFEKNMDDDLNISGAMGNIFSFINETNSILDKNEISESDKNNILAFLKNINTIINIMNFDVIKPDDKVQQLIDQREKARKNKDFIKSDELRKQIENMGIVLEDTKNGVRWKYR